VQNYCSTFNVIGKFAQSRDGFRVIQSKSVPARPVGALRCIDACFSSASHCCFPSSAKDELDLVLFA
jgi:hypothetical protein